MEISIDQLLVTIGRQTVEIDLLRQQVSQLQSRPAEQANGQKESESLESTEAVTVDEV